MRSDRRSLIALGLIVGAVAVTACNKQELGPVIGGFAPYVPPEDPERARLELDLLEVVMREVLLESRKSTKSCFIAFGRASSGDWITPPERFVKRLSDLERDIRPVERARFPRDGEQKHGRYRGVETMDTAQPASIFYVQVCRWIDEATVELDSGRYGGPLDGGSSDGAIYRLEQGTWKRIKDGQQSIH